MASVLEVSNVGTLKENFFIFKQFYDLFFYIYICYLSQSKEAPMFVKDSMAKPFFQLKHSIHMPHKQMPPK